MHPGYTLGGVYAGYPPGIPPWCIYAGYPSWYTPPLVHLPGYTHHATPRATVAYHQAGRDRVAALRRTVTEQTVSDGPLTVAKTVLSLLTRFTVGRCWRVSANLPYNTVGRRHVAQKAPLPSITRFTVGGALRVCLSVSFCHKCGNQAGILLDPEQPVNHPFHWPAVRNVCYSHSGLWEV